MKPLIEIITDELKKAFEAAGYDPGRISVKSSDRPDLCEFQSSSAMALAKEAKKAPIIIAGEVAEILKDSGAIFEEVSVAPPGFINLKIDGRFLADYIGQMAQADTLHGSYDVPSEHEPAAARLSKIESDAVDASAPKVIIDYGGPNVAKPLHIGHLRSAVIGESIKRIMRFAGFDAIGDVHLGDFGLQMGQIIAELKCRKPDLPYFSEFPKDSCVGGDPMFFGSKNENPSDSDNLSEPPFTLAELEEIYPAASAKCKPASPAYDEKFYEKAKEYTAKLQEGDPACTAIWRHVINVSVADLKKNYEKLDVHFELWNGESDAQPYVKDVVDALKERGLLYESEGALVVDIAEPTDKKELPPCLVIKSDGAILYATTDLATIVSRMKNFNPAKIIYVVDKRQELHFMQVFRTAKKGGLVSDDTELSFLGFGTMNGTDGKPFKTRDGGVLRLETLIAETEDAVRAKMRASEADSDAVHKIALAALKYGDLSNQATKDYVFDLNKFTEFEGNTGPYILYTIVRIKSILRKAAEKDVIQLAADAETETDNHPINSDDAGLEVPLAAGSGNKTYNHSFDSDDAGLEVPLAAGSGNKTYNHSFDSDDAGLEVFSEGLKEQEGLDVKGQNSGANIYVSNIAFTGQPSEKSLLLALSGFAETVRAAAADLAPHKICSYVYEVATAFSGFYHDVRILAEPDINKRASYLALLRVTQRVLETCINLLGFDAPERM